MHLKLAAAALAGLVALPAMGQDSPSTVLSMGIGAFRPERSEHAVDEPDLALMLGAERRLASGLRFGLDLTLHWADLRLPAGLSCGPFCVISDTTALDVLGVVPKIGYGVQFGRLELYAGAGLGLYFSRLTAHGSTFGLPGELEERDTGTGTELHAGMRVEVAANKLLGLELRRLSLKGNFGVLSNNADIPIGGDFFLVSYHQRFP